MREVGEKLEKHVIRRCRNAGLKAYQTANSGAARDDADIRCGRFLIECKAQEERNGKPVRNMKIDKGVFDKLKRQAQANLCIPVQCIGNGVGDVVVVMELDTLLYLLLSTQEPSLEEDKELEHEP